MKKSLTLTILFAALLLTAISCKKDDPKPAQGKDDPKNPPADQKVEVTGVTLNEETLTLEVGTEGTLTATVTPENATDKTITWSSSDTDIATVENGKVTAVAAGEATITAATANGKTATCQVTVVQEYTIGEVTRVIKSAAYYYEKSADGYTIHLFDVDNPVLTDDLAEHTYYPSTYNSFAIDIAGSAIGINCDFQSDADKLYNDDWDFFLTIFNSEGNTSLLYPSDLTGSILVDLAEDGTLTIELDAVDTEEIVYKAKCNLKAISAKYYLHKDV